jgi:hypothetical protein
VNHGYWYAHEFVLSLGPCELWAMLFFLDSFQSFYKYKGLNWSVSQSETHLKMICQALTCICDNIAYCLSFLIKEKYVDLKHEREIVDYLTNYLKSME